MRGALSIMADGGPGGGIHGVGQRVRQPGWPAVCGSRVSWGREPGTDGGGYLLGGSPAPDVVP